MLLACLVIEYRVLLYNLQNLVVGNNDFFSLGKSVDNQLESIEQFASITIGKP